MENRVDIYNKKEIIPILFITSLLFDNNGIKKINNFKALINRIFDIHILSSLNYITLL